MQTAKALIVDVLLIGVVATSQAFGTNDPFAMMAKSLTIWGVPPPAAAAPLTEKPPPLTLVAPGQTAIADVDPRSLTAWTI